MDKKQILDWVDELKLPEVFAELDEVKVQDHLLEKLRNEFILGTKDVDFINRLKVFISSLKDKTGQDSLNLYVITATKSEIERNGKTHKVKMPLERYHDELEKWQPFAEPESSKTILTEYKKRKGFSLSFQYLSSYSCAEVEERDLIRENRKNMVLWSDLLALHESNEEFTRYFDDGEIGGLLVSVCPSDPEEIQNHKYICKITWEINSCLCRSFDLERKRFLGENTRKGGIFYKENNQS